MFDWAGALTRCRNNMTNIIVYLLVLGLCLSLLPRLPEGGGKLVDIFGLGLAG